jgi:hypothetical protein
MVVFGGYDFEYINELGQEYVGLKNDIWIFDQGTGWQEVNITNSTFLPVARVHHTGVYDILNDVMIIMGGSSFIRYAGTRCVLKFTFVGERKRRSVRRDGREVLGRGEWEGEGERESVCVCV